MDLIGDGRRCEDICKYASPETKKWPCVDCDMRWHDRSEPPKESGLIEPTEAEREQDIKFLVHIIFEIRDYARSVGQEPDDTLKTVANWILAMLEIATFNGEGET